MGRFAFLTGEEYNSLPSFLKKEIDKISSNLDLILNNKNLMNKKYFSLKFLKEIKKLLILGLIYPNYLDKEMISSIGLGRIGAEIELIPTCEKAIEELIDAEIKEDINSFLREIIQKIDLVIFHD
ncbi:MAG: hypothetical protein KJ939_06745 [Nanoarchaeota archaeon]|nr:hypothetical protein [Nanoarchaeota archaeon]MBU4352743.1 hypothetical protein [Nanoarchaeota archaeon]